MILLIKAVYTHETDLIKIPLPITTRIAEAIKTGLRVAAGVGSTADRGVLVAQTDNSNSNRAARLGRVGGAAQLQAQAFQTAGRLQRRAGYLN